MIILVVVSVTQWVTDESRCNISVASFTWYDGIFSLRWQIKWFKCIHLIVVYSGSCWIVWGKIMRWEWKQMQCNWLKASDIWFEWSLNLLELKATHEIVKPDSLFNDWAGSIAHLVTAVFLQQDFLLLSLSLTKVTAIVLLYSWRCKLT